MKIAIKEAKKAEKLQEVPVGAVIVKDGKIISKGYNLRENKKNSLKHAEIIAIDKACKKLKNFRLENCEMYVTVEPCIMCAGAIIQSRIKKVYFGTRDSKYGAVVSATNTFSIPSNHKVDFEEGLCKDECEKIMKEFFRRLREKKAKS